ncbi:MAG TPA: hypothetical protein VFR97_07820 [Capillimicrobium sp.]|nr:hypothetical protein [Capillimicrobium sp.]
MSTDQPAWERRPDGSRVRIANGIKITLRPRRPEIEHLVTWQEDGTTRILGLDEACRPVYETSLEPRSAG